MCVMIFVVCAHEMTVVCAVKEVACTFYVFSCMNWSHVDYRNCIEQNIICI